VREQFVAYHSGDWERAVRLCTEARDHRIDARNLLEVAATSHTLAWTLRFLGRLDETEETMRRCLDFTAGNFLAAELIERTDIAIVCARTGRLDEAREHLGRCREIIGNGEDWRGRAGCVDWAAGVIAAAAGAMDEANQHFARAVQVLGRYESVIEWAEALYWWGRTLGLDEKLDEAIAMYERIGAGRPFIDRAEAARI
jgi:tetratricopeptide (TPR) repeat protein